MTDLDLVNLTPNERLLAEQAVMNFRALRSACQAAPDGAVLGVAEVLAMEQGREATRRTLQVALQAEDADIEKKTRRRGSVPADERSRIMAANRERS